MDIPRRSRVPLDGLDDLAEGLDLRGRRLLPGWGDGDPGPLPTPLEPLLDRDVAGTFQNAQIGGEIAVREGQRVAEEHEVDTVGPGEQAQDSESCPLVYGVVFDRRRPVS